MSDVYDAAIEEWGEELQVDKAVEELSELTRELARWHLGYSNEDDLAEEIADAEIILEQLRRMFNDERIDHHKERKLDRLRGRIND